VASGAPRALIFEEDAVLTAEGVRRAGALGRRLADYAAAARDDLGGGAFTPLTHLSTLL
jgi:hypothetical protein